MASALGYSKNPFSPVDPGRLCRGRERWIESNTDTKSDAKEGESNDAKLARWVVSGAVFSDDSARDAKRGVHFSGLTTGTIIRAMFPGKTVVAWCEEGHPHQVPTHAQGVEHYTVTRPQGPLRQWAVRWSATCADEAQVVEAIEAGADAIAILDVPPDPSNPPSRTFGPNGLPQLADANSDPGLPEPMREALYLLTGFRQNAPPAQLFQPLGILDVLTHASALVLLHHDKHARCLGIYAPYALELSSALEALAAEQDTLVVPFAIPPMLARWDRALRELRQDWDPTARGDFPVPPAPQWASPWAQRRGPAPAEASAEE